MTALRLHRPALAGLLVLLAGGCGDPAHPTMRIATSMEILSGDGQTGRAGQALPQPVRVRLTDANRLFVDGYRLAFTVVSGGGSVSASPVTTNRQGEASVVWTLGPDTGAPQRLEISGALGLTPRQVTATATP